MAPPVPCKSLSLEQRVGISWCKDTSALSNSKFAEQFYIGTTQVAEILKTF